jgi:hypothetical protein
VLASIGQSLNAHGLCLDSQPRHWLAVRRVQVLCRPYYRILWYIQSSVELGVFVCAMVEDVSQGEVLVGAVRLRREGWRWEDGELGCTADGEERQQQGSCYARCRAAKRSSAHVVVSLQGSFRVVKLSAAGEGAATAMACINDDVPVHAAGPMVTRGRARISATVHHRTAACCRHDSHSFVVDREGISQSLPHFLGHIVLHAPGLTLRLLDSASELRRNPLRMTLFQ